MNEKKIKWVLLLVSFIIIPVPFIAPMAGIYFSSLAYILIGGFEVGLNAFGVIIFTQVIIYIVVFYFLIRLLVRKYINNKSAHEE